MIMLSRFYEDPCGDETHIEISDELSELLIDLDKQWKRLLRRDKRNKANGTYMEGITESCLSLSQQDEAVMDAVIRLEVRRLIRTALTTLSPTQRRRVIAYFYLDQSYTQIARTDGVSVASVRESVHKALEHIRKFL